MKENKKEKKNKVDEEQAVNEPEQELVEEQAPEQKLIDRGEMTDEEYISALEEKLGEAYAQAQECKSVAQRLQADFDNYRKRNNSIAEEMRLLGQSTVIEKMLTVLDNCDLARKYIQDQVALTGFNMMETQIVNALKGFGLETVETDGKEFDAKFMTAVERVKDEENAGKVVETTQKGYMLNGKLLRPACVKVGYADEQKEG